MTHVDPRFVEDLMLRNYSPHTVKAYSYHLGALSRFCGSAPDRITIEQVRKYLLHVRFERNCSWSWWRQALAAFRFYYGSTLGRRESLPRLPHPRREIRLPQIMSKSEVERLIQATSPARHRLLLMTIYSVGLRLSEALALTPDSIDSHCMRIHIRLGKGKVDRVVPLSTVLLDALRDYWRLHGRRDWLFPGRSAERPLSSRAAQAMTRRARLRAGIRKRVTPHTLRHSYATHMLEAGNDIRVIQRILGHKRIRSTLRYIHLHSTHIPPTPSPLDSLNVPLTPRQLALPGL